MPFCASWEETDTGFAEDTPTSVLLSDELQTELRTKFLWHFIPTYQTVQGTEYEEDFMKLAVAIYAAHWPEDVACGIKQTRRTCISKRVVSPDSIDTSDWDQTIMPPWYSSKDQEKALERNRLVRATLYSFYKDNNMAYMHSLAQCTKKEAQRMQLGLSRAVRNFLVKAIKEASPYIKSYGLSPSRWKISLYGAVFLWAIHNLMPQSFHQEHRIWSHYRYLVRPPEGKSTLEIAWEYPRIVDESVAEKDSEAMLDPWEPWRENILF